MSSSNKASNCTCSDIAHCGSPGPCRGHETAPIKWNVWLIKYTTKWGARLAFAAFSTLTFLFCGAQFRHLRPPRETVRKTSCVLGNPDPAVVKIFPTFLNSLAMDPVTVFFWKCRNEILVHWRKKQCCSCFQTCPEFHQNVAKVILPIGKKRKRITFL